MSKDSSSLSKQSVMPSHWYSTGMQDKSDGHRNSSVLHNGATVKKTLQLFNIVDKILKVLKTVIKQANQMHSALLKLMLPGLVVLLTPAVVALALGRGFGVVTAAAVVKSIHE